MRFKKGDKVEVFAKFGYWRSATIISGNGRMYMVSYNRPESCQGLANVDRVPRKAMRPMPPPVKGLEYLHPGDIVEVFFCGSWIFASVVSTVDGTHFFVKLFGTAQELRVHKMKLRLSQFWQDDQWFLTLKEHQNSKETTAVYELIHELVRKKIRVVPSLPVSATEKTKPAASRMVEDCESVCAPSFPDDTLKRKYNSNSFGADSKPVKRHCSSPLVKVDAAHASSQVIVDERSLRDSFTPLLETDGEESVDSNDVSCFPSIDFDFNEAESNLTYPLNNNDYYSWTTVTAF